MQQLSLASDTDAPTSSRQRQQQPATAATR